MRDHFFDAKRCDRCGADLSGGRIMSMFNTQVICMACAEKERQREDYRQAVEADHEAIRQGNYNFLGIGKINCLKINNKKFILIINFIFPEQAPQTFKLAGNNVGKILMFGKHFIDIITYGIPELPIIVMTVQNQQNRVIKRYVYAIHKNLPFS